MASALHPPKPRLVFRVGVVGHRPNRLMSADRPRLAAQLHLILSLTREKVREFGAAHPDLFATGQPVLRAVSPLAEGVDRLLADEALGLGYELCCPMPFPQDEFEKDFIAPRALEADSRERFRELLARAERQSAVVRFEMDGDRTDLGDAYGACGRVLLNQSDLLVVVWDGERLGKRGGTEETFDRARASGVPIVWVDAHAPHSFQLLVGGSSLSSSAGRRQVPAAGDHLDELKTVIEQALDLPRASGPAAGGHGRAVRGTVISDLYAEPQRRVNPAPLWHIFRKAVGDASLSLPEIRVVEYETAVEDDWPKNPTTEHGRVVDRLRPFYAWPDRAAVICGHLYRSTFLLTYLMAAAAVGMALLPLALGWDVYEPHLSETVFVGAELMLILGILFLVWLGRRYRWHERFVDYRLAAELVRHLRISAPLGSTRPFPQVQAQLKNYGHPASTWMAWYARAVERELGLPNVRLDAAHLGACLADLERYVAGQVDFHGSNARRSHRIERRLHRLGVGLFGLTVVACVAHVFAGLGTMATPSPWVLGSLVFLAGFLPALGSALAGINNQGEFARLGTRYDGMFQRLEELKSDVKALREGLSGAVSGAAVPPSSRHVSALASQIAQLMVNEVLDWRIVFLDRPLKEP